MECGTAMCRQASRCLFCLGSLVTNDLTGSPSDEPHTIIRKDGSWSGMVGSLTVSVYTGIDPRCE